MTFLKINNLSIDYKMRKETVNAAKNININILYTCYCKWCKQIECKFVIGKCYFNKFIIIFIYAF